MTRLRLVTAAAVLAPLVLAGCGGDDPEPRLPSAAPSSSTPSASPVSTPTEEPTLPPEAKGNDEAAAEAFVRYYYDVVNYAQATGEVKTLRSLSLPSCDACAGGADYLHEMYRHGGSQEGGAYTVEEVTVFQAAKRQNLRIFETTVDTSTSAYSLRKDSESSAEQFAPGQQAARLRLTWDDSGFSVASLELS